MIYTFLLIPKELIECRCQKGANKLKREDESGLIENNNRIVGFSYGEHAGPENDTWPPWKEPFIYHDHDFNLIAFPNKMQCPWRLNSTKLSRSNYSSVSLDGKRRKIVGKRTVKICFAQIRPLWIIMESFENSTTARSSMVLWSRDSLPGIRGDYFWSLTLDHPL